MQRRKKRIIAAVAVIAALAAGGAAFTANLGSNFPSTTVAGFAQESITGATSSGVNYQLSSDNQYVTEADLYFTNDVTADTIKAGFGDTATDATLVSCGAATLLNSGAHSGQYESVCSFSGSGVPVTTANYFDASVIKDGSNQTVNGS
jgi:hypothetical protein